LLGSSHYFEIHAADKNILPLLEALTMAPPVTAAGAAKKRRASSASLPSDTTTRRPAKGDDIRASAPFVTCNLSDFIGDDGRFDLVSFLELQKACFPTLYKLAVCLSAIRTNEVGCERFFSIAGYVSCPRRTSLKVRNYECLATLKANIQNVFIDEQWVVDQYLLMEKGRSWKDLDNKNDMEVLTLERELHAESMGVSPDALPPIIDLEPIINVEVAEAE
jgi:hypothetical protein